MGSQALQVLRQGVWASLTGGWFLDPHQGAFANCFHLYAWLFLLGLPLLLFSTLPPGPGVGALYCGLVGAFFAGVKTVNYRLHAMFDRGGDPGGGDPEGGGDGGAAALLRPPTPEEGDRPSRPPPGGALELSVLGGSGWPPPVRCSSHQSLCGFNQLSELLPHLEDTAGAKDLGELLRGRGSIVTAADVEQLRRGPPRNGRGGGDEELWAPPAGPPSPGTPPSPFALGGGRGGGSDGDTPPPPGTPHPPGGGTERQQQ